MSKPVFLNARSLALLILALVLAQSTGISPLAAQVDRPASLSGPTSATPGGLPGQPAVPQLIDRTSSVQMILLPWSDPSIRVPPPEQFLAVTAAAAEAAMFQINFLPSGARDPQNSARTCAAWNDNAKAAFSYAASIWAALLYSPVPIRIDACWTNMGSTSILGSSSSNLLALTSGSVTTVYSYALGDKLLGSDADVARPDSAITFNNTFSWYLGTNGQPPSNQVDFVSVVLHEIGHSLNIAGSMAYGTSMCGSAAAGCWGYGSPYPDIYDRFAMNGSSQYLIDKAKFGNPSVALGTQLTSGNIYFSGYNANLANGNSAVKLYAPSTWMQGSSYSHLDDLTFKNTPNRLMVWAIPSGASIHDPGAVAMGMLEDMGWAPSVSINDVSLLEGNSGTTNANFTVSLSHAVSWPVSISWATAAGTASPGIDYVEASGTATIAAGATSQTLTVRVNGDTAFEPDETFYVNLTNPAGAYGFADSQGLGAILNDDPPPAPAVTPSISSSTLALTWPYIAANITYQVYRSTSPYFAPDAVQPLPVANYCTGGANCKYQASVASTDPNYYFIVRATNSGRLADSNRTGMFRFGLAVP